MGTEMSGSLLSVTGTNAWKGGELTNGFLMRNADGRVAAITQSGVIDLTENGAVNQAVPFGNGLVRVISEVDTSDVNILKSGALNDSIYHFAGVVKYEPGWAISHPVQNWGIPSFSKFTAITRGIVGYKFSQKAGQTHADYLAFIKGDKSKVTAIDTFDDWMTALAASGVTGSNLYLLISLATGFPRVVVGGADRRAVSVPAGYMLVAQAVVFEPENGMVGFELDGEVVYGEAGESEPGLYSITFDGNGSTGGSVPVDGNNYDTGDEVVLPDEGTLVKTGETFVEWNTAANGTDIGYPAGSTLIIGSADVTLYAIWAAEPDLYSITFDGNGNTGGDVPVDSNDYEAGDEVVLPDEGTLVKTGETFVEWNTAANGTGIGYPASSTLIIGSADVTLYAIWAA